jgi:threonine dehydrogenase-like Zn-dependent dehydrogenase
MWAYWPNYGSSVAMNASMHAAVIVRPRELNIVEVPAPQAKAREVRIRLEGTGVCASNLSLWDGAPWFQYPMPTGQGGHEAWGVVDQVGYGVERSWLGKRVAALSNHAYAEYDLAQVDQLVALPDALGGQPFPGEALGCAMNIFRRSHILRGQTLAIVGIGFLGALLTRLGERAGARVVAISRRDEALQVARQMGAYETIPMRDHREVIERAVSLTEGRGYDCVIEATGKQWPLDIAGELTREHGRLVIAGYHQDGPRSVNMQLWNYRGLEVSNAHERNPAVCLRGMQEAVDAVAAGWLDPRPLYTHAFELNALGTAFDLTRDRPAGFMKALIRLGQRA